MKAEDKRALCSLYIESLGGPRQDITRESISRMAASGMAGAGRSLTERGRAAIRVVAAGGVFDIIHPGHISTLSEARALGDMLVVIIATDATAIKMKKRRPLHAEGQRQALVGSLNMVDYCIIGSSTDIFETVSKVVPDVIALGYDQAHGEDSMRDGCKKIGISPEIVRLGSPSPDISSGAIEKEYGSAIHGI